MGAAGIDPAVPREAEDGTTGSLTGPAEIVAQGIQTFVCAVLIVVWTVVGFVFWIPFLVRSIAIYTTAVLAATFTGSSRQEAHRALDTAIRFWFVGFQAAFAARHSLHSGRHTERESGRPAGNLYDLLISHLVFSLLFWLSVVLFWMAPWRAVME